jgi:hypothetical protein
LYPLTAAARAIPTPVFPEVASISVSPFFIRFYASASNIILIPIRSLTEPPILRNSHFTKISHLTPRDYGILLSLTIGVKPSASKASSYTFFYNLNGREL